MGDVGLLVGRHEELAFLSECVTIPPYHGVIVAGGAGVGKSRLVAHFADSLPIGAWFVERVRATRSASTIPFGAFAHYLGAATTEPVGRLEALCRVADELQHRADGARLALVVDDTHLLDEGSAALVLHLVEREQATVLAAIRTGEPQPDAVVALWKEGLVERLDLQPLSQPETARLTGALVGPAIAGSAEDRVWALTKGNPLFVREVVRAATEQGVLTERNGIWRWDGTLRRHERLAELIADRLGALPDDVRRVLELVALGEPIPLALLGDLVSADAVQRAEQRDLVRAAPDKGGSLVVRLAHPLYGELLRVTMAHTTGIELRRALADAFAAVDAEAEVLRIASWRLEAGATRDPALFVAASRRAMVAGDFALAERLAGAAELAGGGGPAAITRGEALRWLGDHRAALDALARVEDDPEASADDRFRASLERASCLAFGLGELERALLVLRQARERAHGSDRGELLAHEATFVFLGGRLDETLRLTDDVLATPGTSQVARLRALSVAIPAWGLQGHLSVARAAADLGVAHALPIADEVTELMGGIMVGRCLIPIEAGELSPGENEAMLIHQVVVEERRREGIGPFTLILGRVALLRGDAVAASRLLDDAAERLATHDFGGFLPWCHGLRAMSAALQGRSDEADAAIGAARATANPAIGFWDPSIEAAAGWASAARGDLRTARDHARESARLAATVGNRLWEAHAWHDVARFGDAGAAAVELARLAISVEGPLVDTAARHAHALANADANGLDAVADAFEAWGALLFAAEAAAEAAAAHLAAGYKGRHLRSADRSRALAASCGGVVSPALRVAASDAVSLMELTSREREVVELAARGLSNREIAQRLYISMRTVNNHLTHVYAKLGVEDRADLAYLFGIAPAQDE